MSYNCGRIVTSEPKPKAIALKLNRNFRRFIFQAAPFLLCCLKWQRKACNNYQPCYDKKNKRLLVNSTKRKKQHTAINDQLQKDGGAGTSVLILVITEALLYAV